MMALEMEKIPSKEHKTVAQQTYICDNIQTVK